MRRPIKALALAIAAVLCCAPLALADQIQEWKLVNPSGEIERFAIAPAERLDTLDGKTVVLRWNAKPNGNLLLDYLAERLVKDYPTVKLIKAYETNPETSVNSGNNSISLNVVTKALRDLQPDLVISSQAD